MSVARHLTYWKMKTWSKGSPRIDAVTGAVRNISGMEYNKDVVASLAYRGCCRLRSDETGITHDYRSKDHLLHSHVAAPPGCAWSSDRERFANSVMSREKRYDARVGREIVLVCPKGLEEEKFVGEVVAYANYLSRRYRTSVYADVHDPKRNNPILELAKRNLHCHIVFPTREVNPDGLGEKISVLDNRKRSGVEVETLREEWARHLERGFRHQGESEQFDHRSNLRRGINRIPQPKLGRADAMHKRGLWTERMDLFEDVARQNEELSQLEVAMAATETNLRTLEKLETARLSETTCLKAEARWTGSAYKTHYHLDINASMGLVERLGQKIPVFAELHDDMMRLKRRCNDELDFEPTIDDVPADSCVNDLFVFVAQLMSEKGLGSAKRDRKREAPRISTVHMPPRSSRRHER